VADKDKDLTEQNKAAVKAADRAGDLNPSANAPASAAPGTAPGAARTPAPVTQDVPDTEPPTGTPSGAPHPLQVGGYDPNADAGLRPEESDVNALKAGHTTPAQAEAIGRADRKAAEDAKAAEEEPKP
jgi:hypothetical protein